MHCALAQKLESVTNLHLFSESNTTDFKMCSWSIRKVTENHTIFDSFRLRNTVTSVFFLMYHNITMQTSQYNFNESYKPIEKNLNAPQIKDTWHFSVLIDDHEVGEITGYTLRNDPLQSKTSSVVHMCIRYDCCQLLTKPYSSLK